MLNRIDFWAKRVVAIPLVFVGAVLTAIAGRFIWLGAWLLDRDDILAMFKERV